MHLQLLFYFLYFITTKGNTHVIIIYVCKSNYFSCKIFQNCWDTLTLKMSLIYEMWYKFAFYPVMKNNAFFIKKCFSIFLVWLKSLYRKKNSLVKRACFILKTLNIVINPCSEFPSICNLRWVCGLYFYLIFRNYTKVLIYNIWFTMLKSVFL